MDKLLYLKKIKVAYPTVTSNMLLPTDEDTAISPKPFLATMTEVMRSGMEVPAARAVRPITSGGMPSVSPSTVAHHTIRYEYAAIQTMLPRNVTAKNFLPADANTEFSFYSSLKHNNIIIITTAIITFLVIIIIYIETVFIQLLVVYCN